jgi:hypothetical protein
LGKDSTFFRGLGREKMAPSGQHGGSSIAILPDMWTDELSAQYADLLDGSYNCVDRIVLNAYCTLCYSAGGFRTWWRRLHDGSDDDLDDNHLMRMAGRFSRRLTTPMHSDISSEAMIRR